MNMERSLESNPLTETSSTDDPDTTTSSSCEDFIDSHLGMINVSSAATFENLVQSASVDGTDVYNLPVRVRSRQDDHRHDGTGQRRKTAPTSTFRKLKASLVEISGNTAFNLYFAKLLQAWGDRMWIFAIPILLMELRRDPIPALFFPALYGFCSGASTILFGPVMGEWVDKVSRLRAAKVVTICQNGFIGCAGVLLGVSIHFSHQMSNWQLYLCVAVLMILSFAANIFYAATVVVLEKDWVAVIAGNDKSRLASIISTIRRIELATNVLCPLVMAQIMTYAGKDVTAAVIGLWSFTSIFVEYRAMRRTCFLAGEVMMKKKKPKIARRKPILRKLCKSCYAIYEGWSIFAKNKVCTAGLSVAFLEATVLIFSGVTNSYAVQQGLSSTAVALLAGGDALTGILGTFVFPVLRKRFSLEKIGLTAMVFHFLCGSVCVSSNWLPGSPFDPMFLLSDRPAASSTPWSPGPVLGTTASPFSLAENNFAISLNGNFSVTLKPGDVRQLNNSTIGGATGTDWTSLIVFSAGLTLGRFAFWVIDLTGSQILLESVRDEHRGTICAVHYALKKLLNRVKYVMALFLAWPQTFGFLIIASQIFSLMGYGFFVVYCRIESVRKRCDTSAKSSNQKLNFREIQQ